MTCTQSQDSNNGQRTVGSLIEILLALFPATWFIAISPRGPDVIYWSSPAADQIIIVCTIFKIPCVGFVSRRKIATLLSSLAEQ